MSIMEKIVEVRWRVKNEWVQAEQRVRKTKKDPDLYQELLHILEVERFATIFNGFDTMIFITERLYFICLRKSWTRLWGS